jgi:L-fuconolactonase
VATSHHNGGGERIDESCGTNPSQAFTSASSVSSVVTRVDAHQHFWRYDPAEYAWIDDAMAALRRDFLPADAAREMAAAGVDACVAVQARQTLEETRWLLALAGTHPLIAGVVGWVDLQADDAHAQLERLASNPKLIGVRHIVQSEADDRFLLRPAFCRGIALLEAFALTYDILVYARHLPVVVEFVARFERQPFVLDHLGKPDVRRGEITTWEKDIRRLAACPNVFCKLSGLVTEADWERWTAAQLRPYLDVAFDSFGVGRLLLGSDWPVCTVAASYAHTLGVVTDYLSRHSAEDRAAVLGGNAQRLWNLKVNAISEERGDLRPLRARRTRRAGPVRS